MADLSTASNPRISGIIVKFETNMKWSAKVWIGNSHWPIDESRGRKSLQRTFYPPEMLSKQDTFSLYVEYIDTSLFPEKKTKKTILKPDDIFRAYTNSEQEYIGIDKKITITIKLSRNTTTEVVGSPDESLELQPTTGTSEISQIGPRFRILVAGKAGVGKSTLIHRAFGVETAFPSSDKRGKADIEHEFIPPKNDRLVIHDSNGFEAVDEENLKIVRDFIDHRRNMSPEHQLHAIWLCFQIPSAGGRFLDTATEEILTWARSEILGNVPIIAVFTKYDMLIDLTELSLDETSIDGLSDEAIRERAKDNAEVELRDTCIVPLEQFAGPGIPCATTSAERGYEETLIHLIELTERHVAEHSASEAAVMTSVARRMQPRRNIKASIEAGKRRYRKTLSLGTIFMKHKMRDRLYVLHTDIVNVWELRDPHDYLLGPEFREVMIKMVEVGSTKGYRHFSLGPSGLQRFMSYIVDLTLVLQTLYLMSESHEVTRRAIKLAVNSYSTSPMSKDVRNRIQDYGSQLTILERMDRDTLNKLAEVMQFSSIDAIQVPEHVDLSLDEQW